MTTTLAVFPGQGSQKVGMGAKLLKDFPKAKLHFEAAEDACRLSIRKICLEGPKETLSLTENQQPCILTLSIAVWHVLCDESPLGEECSLFAGHSLGEYSALVASKRLEFEHAVKLVSLRGQAMQRAVPKGVGSMAAILNFDSHRLIQMCESATKGANELTVELVNFNTPGQHIISGHKKLVDQICEELKQEKIRALPLPISAPFHSKLMQPARIEMSKHLNALDLSQGVGKVIANLNGEAFSQYENEFLIRQIDNPVLWTKTMAYAARAQATRCVEIGPGKVLSGLAKRCSLDKQAKIIDSDDVSKCIEALTKNQT